MVTHMQEFETIESIQSLSPFEMIESIQSLSPFEMIESIINLCKDGQLIEFPSPNFPNQNFTKSSLPKGKPRSLMQSQAQGITMFRYLSVISSSSVGACSYVLSVGMCIQESRC